MKEEVKQGRALEKDQCVTSVMIIHANLCLFSGV